MPGGARVASRQAEGGSGDAAQARPGAASSYRRARARGNAQVGFAADEPMTREQPDAGAARRAPAAQAPCGRSAGGRPCAVDSSTADSPTAGSPATNSPAAVRAFVVSSAVSPAASSSAALFLPREREYPRPALDICENKMCVCERLGTRAPYFELHV